MSNEIVMPKLHERMSEGSIISWEKGAGDQVEPGEILAVLATDGRQVKLPSFVSGVLKQHLIQPGVTVPVGEVIARMEPSQGESHGEGRSNPVETAGLLDRPLLPRTSDNGEPARHFAVSVHIDMESVETLCRSFREDGVRITVNDFIIKSTVMALLKFPQVNSSLSEQGALRQSRINIGVALSLQHGAVTPVLKKCNGKSLHDLARESRSLMDRARKGTLAPDETMGGTFTVANLGMYGVDEYQSIVRTPEAAILAVGAVRNAPIVAEGRVIPGRVMTATLSADQRLLDGADAGLFMAELRRLLEHPAPVLANGTP
jgi:pyruvate/2-oxoglutarate dehydrogenase complex dihydrolipoamide acyltransferase (E2) component